MGWTIIGTGSALLEADVADDYYDSASIVSGAAVGDVILCCLTALSLGSYDYGISGGTSLGAASSTSGLDVYWKAIINTGSAYVYADGLDLEIDVGAMAWWIILRPDGTPTYDKVSSYSSGASSTTVTIPTQTVSNADSISVACVLSEDAIATRTLGSWNNYTEQLDTKQTSSIAATTFYGAFGTRTGDAESIGTDAVTYTGTQDALKAFIVTLYDVAAAAGLTIYGVECSKIFGVEPTAIYGVP